jgi:hypothetical protein
MKIFMSWSGNKSRGMATALGRWAQYVLPHVETFLSRDLERHRPWFEQLMVHLRTSQAGIVCLTEDSWRREWLHFEAGALHLADKPVFVVLLDVHSGQLSGPFAQFQHTTLEELDDEDDYYDLLRMFKSLNEVAGADALPIHRLEERYRDIWESLRRDLLIVKEMPPEDRRKESTRRHAEVLQRLDRLSAEHEAIVEAISPRLDLPADWPRPN